MLTQELEKLPQGAAVDAVQRARVESHGVGGAQGQAQGAFFVSLDEGSKRAGAMMHSPAGSHDFMCTGIPEHIVPVV